MTNNTQIRTKRISFILALLVIAYVAVDTYLFTYHKINTTTITTPVIIGLVVTILLCGLLQRFFYTWLTKNPINFSFDRQSPIITDSGFEIKTDCADEIQTIEQPNNSVIDNYDTIRENIKKKEAEKQDGGNRTMGRKATIPYDLYVCHGFISANLAQQTGFSEEDLELFWNALKNMFDVDRSAARGLMSAQKLIVFKHDSILGNAPANKLFELVKVEKVCDGAPRSFIDYSVTIDKENAPSNVTIEELI